MIIKCTKCNKWFEDVYRDVECPHATFPANNGMNIFRHRPESYLSRFEPAPERVYEAHKSTT